MDTIAVAEVQRGDLLLVTRRERDPLANLIMELDGSPDGFSHCGIALGDGRILSAFPEFTDVEGLDFGGLSEDPFSFFWGHRQHIHRLEVEPAERDDARRRLSGHLPPSGGFSIPKIVMVAAALHALAPANDIEPEATDQVVRSAIAAAAEWAGDGDYYCAEFVADLYGWNFTLDDLAPPPLRGVNRLTQTLVNLTVDVAEDLLTAGRSIRQQALLHVFIEDVRDHDPTFFAKGVLAAFNALLGRAPAEVEAKKSEMRAHRNLVAAPALGRRTPLPRPLVTPRMLRARRRQAGIPEIRQE